MPKTPDKKKPPAKAKPKPKDAKTAKVTKVSKAKKAATKTKKPAAADAPARALPPLAIGPNAAVLDRLWSVVMSRRDADPAVSHSARLLSRGKEKVAQKFGEEAVECLIEAISGNHDALVAESADVLYHLLVVWVAGGVHPDEVWAELKRREGVSGIAEKASRARNLPVASGVQTTKIP